VASAQIKPASPPPVENTGMILNVLNTGAAPTIAAIGASVTPSFRKEENWTGDYPECGHKAEFLKNRDEHMDVGVLIDVKNPLVAEQFRKAMNFWSKLIDMNWHEVADFKDCAIAVVPGTQEVLKPNLLGRAQRPSWPNFKGLLAWDTNARNDPNDIYITAIHEIGHVLGLNHNKNYKSVMYWSDVDSIFVMKLDNADLRALNEHHALRSGFERKLKNTHAQVTVYRPPVMQLARATLGAKFHTVVSLL
jgi:hypothetical protein